MIHEKKVHTQKENRHTVGRICLSFYGWEKKGGRIVRDGTHTHKQAEFCNDKQKNTQTMAATMLDTQ